MKKIILALAILSVFALAVSASFADNTLNNTTDFQKAVDDAKLENKSIMLVFDQKNCVYCDMFKEDVLSNDTVISKLNEGYITAIVDINKDAQLASKFKIYGTPTIVFLDSNQKEIYRIEGYVDAGDFLDALKGM